MGGSNQTNPGGDQQREADNGCCERCLTMAKPRKSKRMREQIRVLIESGVSIRKVAQSLGISRQSVRKYVAEDTPGVATPTAVEPLVASGGCIDWEKALAARAQGVSIKQLHSEHAPELSYWNFWRQLTKRRAQVPTITLRIEHKPGERVEIDYADGISVVDPRTGEVHKTHLFCGVLPFSSYTFAEFVTDQKLPSFIASQERMWRFFGGVTPYVVIDNLRSGVKKAHRYDPDINPTYCDYSNHVGFAVLPARPYKPRDKASVEAAIGVIQRGYFQEQHNRSFYSLSELNEELAAYLSRLNQSVMKDYGKSRRERFSVEQPLLKPIPSELFELSTWKECKVHPDCHIQVERNFYSVPHQVVGQTLRVKISSKLIEVFTLELEPIAAHARLHGCGRFSTNEAHYPEQKLGIKRFEVRAAQKQAERIGPHTLQLVQALIDADYPLRHLRRIQGILRLASDKSLSSEALEYACQQALAFKQLRFAYVKACAVHFANNGARPVLVGPKRNADEVYLHGANDTTLGGQS
jgi:transposase